MSYDEKLADRVRRTLPPTPGITEKHVFGGIAFLLDGKMFVGVVGTDLMVRVGPDAHAAALSKNHVRPMDFTGRPLAGFVYVGAEGTRTAARITPWIEQSLRFVATSPVKRKKVRKPPR